MNEMENKKPRNATQAQIDILIEYVKQNPELVSGKFTATNTRISMQKKWTEVTSILNLVADGAYKDCYQWKRTWNDQKRKFEEKKRENNRSLKGTGGGPSTYVELSADELMLSNLVPSESVLGNQSIAESSVSFILEDSLVGDPMFDSDCKENQQDRANSSETTQDETGIDNIYSEGQATKIIEKSRSLYQGNTQTSEEKVDESQVNDAKKVDESQVNDAKKVDESQVNDAKKVYESQVNDAKKVEDTVKIPSKRSLAVQRQDASIKNCKDMIDVSNKELELREQYYNRKLQIMQNHHEKEIYLMKRKVILEKKRLQSKGLMMNKMTQPWRSHDPPLGEKLDWFCIRIGVNAKKKFRTSTTWRTPAVHINKHRNAEIHVRFSEQESHLHSNR